MRCFMDPIMQKTGPTPDQKLRRAMYDAVPERKADPECVTVLGSDFVLDESADICRILKKNGIRLREAPACKTWEDYQSLGEGSLILNCYPAGKFGVQQQAERLGRPFLYLPGSFDYEEIETRKSICWSCWSSKVVVKMAWISKRRSENARKLFSMHTRSSVTLP